MPGEIPAYPVLEKRKIHPKCLGVVWEVLHILLLQARCSRLWSVFSFSVCEEFKPLQVVHSVSPFILLLEGTMPRGRLKKTCVPSYAAGESQTRSPQLTAYLNDFSLQLDRACPLSKDRQTSSIYIGICPCRSPPAELDIKFIQMRQVWLERLLSRGRVLLPRLRTPFLPLGPIQCMERNDQLQIRYRENRFFKKSEKHCILWMSVALCSAWYCVPTISRMPF